MNFTKSILLLFLTVAAPIAVVAQTRMVGGKVADAKTREGIPFAHIVLEGTRAGAIADLNGNFSLAVPQELEGGLLVVSCVGYKTLKIAPGDTAQPLLILLEQDVIRLKEVVILQEDALNLLRKAIRKIPENYDTAFTKLSGYYKVSTLLEDKSMQYTEALIDIMNRPYVEEPERKDRPLDSIYVRQARLKPKEIDDWKLDMMLPWERSIYNIEFRDIARDLIGRKELLEKFLDSYDFELDNLVMINGRSAYTIRLLPKKHRKEAYWNGYLCLDQETLAIVKWETVSTPRMFRQLRGDLGYIILSKIYRVHYDEGEWKERITYEKKGDEWHLAEVNSSKLFRISSRKRDMENVPVTVNLQYRTDSVTKISRPDTLDYLPGGWGWQVADYLRKRYDTAFWHAFDRVSGITTNDSSYHTLPPVPEPAYKITRLDSLQGALTPLRTCFDVTFYHLDVEVLPDEEIIKGSNLIRFRVTQPTRRIQIDLFSGMTIDRILWNSEPLEFSREYNAVYVDFPASLHEGSSEEITVYYSGRPVDLDPRIPMYAAFLWAEDENQNPWLQAICQGYGASAWWPNKDHLSDEPDSMRLSYTVPSELDVVANGRLRSKTVLPGARTRYDWFVSYPINNYNATLNLAKYERMADKYVNDEGDTLDLEYYVLPYHLENARQRLSVVKPMLRTFEKYFGKYPFYRDGFKLVESPHAMEHQSCVALDGDYFANPEPPRFSDEDINFSLLLHESAHEWWGNNVSCTDNAELWLHESFARYAEALYIEDHYGYGNSQRYLHRMKAMVANKEPVIGPRDINYIHHGNMDMYEKGALMLNTLRHVISNDSTWFAILRGIQDEFRLQTIDTDDLVRYVNRCTGTDYTSFFDQYLRQAAIPALELAFEERDGKSFMLYRWAAAAHDFAMPVKLKLGDEWTLLHPTTEWQRIGYPALPQDVPEVNTDQYYVEVRVVSPAG